MEARKSGRFVFLSIPTIKYYLSDIVSHNWLELSH